MTVGTQYTGALLDDRGVAINGATIELYDVGQNSTVRATTTSNASGIWTIDHGTAGRFDRKIINGDDIIWLRARDQFQVTTLQARSPTTAVPAGHFMSTTNEASTLVAVFAGRRATESSGVETAANQTDGDIAYIDLELANDNATPQQFIAARLSWVALDVTDGSEDGQLKFEAMAAGSLATVLTMDSTGATGSIIKDEDNMSSNSATHLATQQSIKAYVDASTATVDTWAEVLALGNTSGGTDVIMTDGDDLAFGTGSDILLRNRASSAAANLEITDIILGTSVHPGVAANSLLASNITASGDMLFLTNRGGNSEAHILFDASAGDTFIYARGVEAIRAVGGGGVEFSVAIDFDNQNMTNVDIDSGAIDGAIIGAASAAAGTFTTLTADAVVVGAAEKVHFDGSTGGNTYIHEPFADLMEFVVGGFQILGLRDTTGIVLNEAGADLDIRFESLDNTNIFKIDAANNNIGLGNVPSAGRFLDISGNFSGANATVLFTNMNVTQTGGTFGDLHTFSALQTLEDNTVTYPNISQVAIDEPTIAVGGASDTIIRASTLRITGVATEASSGGNNALYIPSGALEVSDGQGTSGEQLTSGGQDGNLTWTTASSVRSSKQDITLNTKTADALAKFVAAPVYDFKYKKTVFETYTEVINGKTRKTKQPVKGKRYPSTGDYETTYVGIMADEAPWAMHHEGGTLNPISTFGYTVLAIQELKKEIEDLKVQLAAA